MENYLESPKKKVKKFEKPKKTVKFNSTKTKKNSDSWDDSELVSKPVKKINRKSEKVLKTNKHIERYIDLDEEDDIEDTEGSSKKKF